MAHAHEPLDDQITSWNSRRGHAWVEAQESLDRVFKPFEDLIVESVKAGSARRVLDVGCGTGSTTLAIARALGAQGRALGVDISEPMIAAALGRAERQTPRPAFVCADAQTYAFEPASFDAIVSRFGVMFFSDSVAAFANLRRAAAQGALLKFIAWRSPADNPFMTTAERAAAPLFPAVPVRDPDAPGQFAFASASRVYGILDRSGWSQIEILPIDVTCTFPEAELIGYFTRLGPLGQVLHQTDEQTRQRVIEEVRAAFEPFVHGTEVRFDAACWLAVARAGA
jgi:SAM-dependent methyltransferase